MIVEGLLVFLVTAVKLVLLAVPDWTPPSELLALSDLASQVGGMAAGVSSWVPWSTVTVCGLTVATAWTMVYGIRLVLFLFGKLPWIGKD